MSKTSIDPRLIKGAAFDIDGVLSPVCTPLGQDGVPLRMANLRDGYALQLAVRQGLKICIITGGNDPAAIKRFKSLGITDIYYTEGSKLPVFEQWMADNGLTPGEVAYVGDDVPDTECLRHAALGIAPADAATDALDAADYITLATGGHGVAREVLEPILKAQDKWPLQTTRPYRQ